MDQACTQEGDAMKGWLNGLPASLRAVPMAGERGWSGAGSNRRPSAFQVNCTKRCADLRKRTSLTSGTALGGRCEVHVSRVRRRTRRALVRRTIRPDSGPFHSREVT